MCMHMHTSSVSNDHFLSHRIALKSLEWSLDENATEGKGPVLQCRFQASFFLFFTFELNGLGVQRRVDM